MARSYKRQEDKRGNPVFTALGVIFLLVGLGSLGYVAWEYFGTNITANQAMDDKSKNLRDQWDSAPASEGTPGEGAPGEGEPAGPEGQTTTASYVPGDAVALLRVPRFGDDYEVPIVAGTDVESLKQGVGWYDASVGPGEVGNFALAGHRITNGEPFAKALELQPGDEIIVETRDAIYTYTMDTSPADLTVEDTETWVLDPVPGKPDETPTKPIITITTCQDLFHSVDRSIGFGTLTNTEKK